MSYRLEVVDDLEAALAELGARGVEIRNVRHKSPIDTWTGGWAPGIDPEHTDHASFADLSDPDGHRWVVQERGFAAR